MGTGRTTACKVLRTLGCLACIDLQNAGALGVSAHGEDGIRRRCRGQALARSNLAFWDNYGLQGSAQGSMARASAIWLDKAALLVV
jgi:hypothetical protein